MTNHRIADIEQHILALKQRKAHLIARDRASERRIRARQAIIVGTWLMANQPETVNMIKARLSRPQDLQAFGLAELEHAAEALSQNVSAAGDPYD